MQQRDIIHTSMKNRKRKIFGEKVATLTFREQKFLILSLISAWECWKAAVLRGFGGRYGDSAPAAAADGCDDAEGKLTSASE